jgi:hypothetical protein
MMTRPWEFFVVMVAAIFMIFAILFAASAVAAVAARERMVDCSIQPRKPRPLPSLQTCYVRL